MGRFDQYTNEARLALSYAREEAKERRHRLIGPEHILLGVLKVQDGMVEALCRACQISTNRVRQSLEFVMGYRNKALLSESVMSPIGRAVLARAWEEAVGLRAEKVDVVHLLLGILGERAGVAAGVLESCGLSFEVVHEHIVRLMCSGFGQQELSPVLSEYQRRYAATPILNEVSRDLTLAALEKELHPFIGREAELEHVSQILARRTKNNPALIGPAGVGKTALAEGLAQQIVQEKVPQILRGCRVVALDVGLLIAGTRYRGDFEERLKRILYEISNVRGIIVVIDELHALMRTGGALGSLDAANLFKPVLARGGFQCIGATTPDEYRRTIEADPALERRFQPVLIAETSTEETLGILRGLCRHYADYYQVTITDEALRAAVELSTQYMRDRYQPDKAIDVLDEAAARAFVRGARMPEEVRKLRMEIAALERTKDEAIGRRDYATALKWRAYELQLQRQLVEVERARTEERQRERLVVSEQDVAEVVAVVTGVPVAQVDTQEARHLLRLEEELQKRVVGQGEAVEAVARAVRRARTGLRDLRRPIGSFVFVGPSGVGKTELAHVLAETVFEDERALLELDMGEFMESHSVSRLIGAPPGYIGYDNPGQLTEAVRRRPYSIVLFDNVEKAHPRIFDLCLQVLEDGCLTDSRGRAVDFRHTIIIMTASVGAGQQRGKMSFLAQRGERGIRKEDFERWRTDAVSALKKLFRPELFNRLDEVVFFRPLEREHVEAITGLLIEGTRQRLAAQGVELQVTGAACDVLIEHGYDVDTGARALRRTVQRMLDDLLAEAILQRSITCGSTVCVNAIGGKLVIDISKGAVHMSARGLPAS